MDVDHLIGRIKILDDMDSHNVNDILINKFRAVELGSSNMYDRVEMFTIDLGHESAGSALEFEIKGIKGFPKIFKGSVEKLRIYKKGNLIHIIPIVYPAVEVANYSSYINSCPLKEFIETGLCNVLSDCLEGNVELHNIMCYNCLMNAFSISLLSEFLLKLSSYVKFEYIGLDDKCIPLYSVFDEAGARIVKAFDVKLKECLAKNKKIAIGNETASTFEVANSNLIKHVDPKINAFMSFKPYNVISQIIIKNLALNKQYLKDKDEALFGLTYRQIFEAYGDGKCYKGFAEGMDIALDIGSLKPVTTYAGLEVISEGKSYNAVVRLYRLTGEETRYSILSFLALMGRNII